MKKEPKTQNLRQQFEERNRQWKEFHRWEAQQPLEEREPGRIIADLGTIWGWLPPEVRLEDPDPNKHGVQAMQKALAHLKSRDE